MWLQTAVFSIFIFLAILYTSIITVLEEDNPSLPFYGEMNITTEIILQRTKINTCNSDTCDDRTGEKCIMSHEQLKAAYQSGFHYPVPLPCAEILKAVRRSNARYFYEYFQRVFIVLCLITYTMCLLSAIWIDDLERSISKLKLKSKPIEIKELK